MTNLNLFLIITTPCCTFSVARACLVISPVQAWISPSLIRRFRIKGIDCFTLLYCHSSHRSFVTYLYRRYMFDFRPTVFIYTRRWLRVSVYSRMSTPTFITASPRVYGYLSLERFLLVLKIFDRNNEARSSFDLACVC